MENDTYSKQYAALVTIPKVTGLLSVIGSFFIIRDLCFKHRNKLRTARNQIVLCMSLSDIISSLFLHVIGTWFVPKGFVYGSAGNIASCTAQGYFGFMAVGIGAGCNAALSISYILTVRYHWKEDKMKKIKPYLILFPIMIFLIISTVGLFYQIYNWGGDWTCDTSASPFGCDFANSDIACERGTNAKYFKYVAFFLASIYFVIIVGSMFSLYWTVLQQEKAGDKFDFRASLTIPRRGSAGSVEVSLNRKQSKKVAVQGIYYVLAYILSIFVYIAVALIALFGGTPPWGLLYSMAVTGPLQGFFNAFVYFRPIYQMQRRKRRSAKRSKKESRNNSTEAQLGRSSLPELKDEFLDDQLEQNVEFTGKKEDEENHQFRLSPL